MATLVTLTLACVIVSLVQPVCALFSDQVGVLDRLAKL